MKVLTFFSVGKALPEGLDYLLREGSVQESRAGRVVVAPGPVTTEYKAPAQCILTSPIRDANPFFHYMEALWMLRGEDDAGFLTPYVRDFGKFAEEDGIIHGAYGARWRWRLGFDQLAEVVSRLQRNKADRQCVLQMWDATTVTDGCDDLCGAWNDRPCLAGETVVWSPEGDLEIRVIAEKFEDKSVSRWPVYGVDPKTLELKLTWATKVWKSGTKKTLRLDFDDGSFMRVTPDHRLYRKSYRKGKNASRIKITEVIASELRVGDRLLATHRYHHRDYEIVKRRLDRNTSFKNSQRTHRAYAELLWGELTPGLDVHHRNEDPRDNREENLELKDHGDHSRDHKLGLLNPMVRGMTEEQHKQRGLKHSESLKKTWANLSPENRKRRAKGLQLIDNHRIIAISEDSETDVYDFTVPTVHTAIVGSGVVSHNCNTHAYFRVREGALDMTVCCRSNDIIMGAYGANAVHFSFLLQYVAGMVGLPVGRYYQVSNDYHAYTADIDRLCGRAGIRPPDYGGTAQWQSGVALRAALGVFEGYQRMTPLVENQRTFMPELHAVVSDIRCVQVGDAPSEKSYENSSLKRGLTLALAHAVYKGEGPTAAIHYLNLNDRTPWGNAASEWLYRRAKAREAKQNADGTTNT